MSQVETFSSAAMVLLSSRLSAEAITLGMLTCVMPMRRPRLASLAIPKGWRECQCSDAEPAAKSAKTSSSPLPKIAPSSLKRADLCRQNFDGDAGPLRRQQESGSND